MPYTITSDTVGLAVGPVSETAINVHEALSKARQHDPSVMSVSTPFSAIDPSLITNSGAKPSRAEFFQTKTERI